MPRQSPNFRRSSRGTISDPDELAARLPYWPKGSRAVELGAILLYAKGEFPNRQGYAFGDTSLLWEVLRHNQKVREIVRKLHLPRDPRQFENYVFSAPIGFIVNTPGFPQLPFAALNSETRSELAELFTAGQKAVECADIRRLDIQGYLKWLVQRAQELRDVGATKDPNVSWKLRDNLNPGEIVFDVTFTVRGHMGIYAAAESVKAELNKMAKQDPKLFSEPRTPHYFQKARDPRLPLRDLAIARLVYLLGFEGALNWTREKRGAKVLQPMKAEEWNFYFNERKRENPGALFDGRREYWERAINSGIALVISGHEFSFSDPAP